MIVIDVKRSHQINILGHKELRVEFYEDQKLVYTREFTLARYYADDIERDIQRHIDKLRSHHK